MNLSQLLRGDTISNPNTKAWQVVNQPIGEESMNVTWP